MLSSNGDFNRSGNGNMIDKPCENRRPDGCSLQYAVDRNIQRWEHSKVSLFQHLEAEGVMYEPSIRIWPS